MLLSLERSFLVSGVSTASMMRNSLESVVVYILFAGGSFRGDDGIRLVGMHMAWSFSPFRAIQVTIRAVFAVCTR